MSTQDESKKEDIIQLCGETAVLYGFVNLKDKATIAFPNNSIVIYCGEHLLNAPSYPFLSAERRISDKRILQHLRSLMTSDTGHFILNRDHNGNPYSYLYCGF